MKKKTTDRTAWSLLIFGGYAMLMGLVLLFLPERVLPYFMFTETSGTWVHVLGFVLCCSAYYYLWAGRSGSKAFARLTVHTRLASPLVMLALLVADKVGHMVLLFGIVYALAGAWTLVALWLHGSERIEKQRGND